jgi:hypothetical protein
VPAPRRMTPLVAEVAGAIKKIPGSWGGLKVGRRGRRSVKTYDLGSMVAYDSWAEFTAPEP